jgi:uncharacterized membrane protein YkoI
MSTLRAIRLIALMVLLGAVGPVAAEDRPVAAPPGQSDRDPQGERPSSAPPGPADEMRPQPVADDGLERARAAARAADPRLQGLERARAAARAADTSGGKDCMSAREARGAIRANRAVTLVKAMQAAREAWDGEVIDYKLCTYDGALAYELTLLNAEGRVARVRVEAANGKFVGVR